MSNHTSHEQKGQAARAWWDLAHGAPSELVADALQLGGRLAPAPAATGGDGARAGSGASAPAATGGDDCVSRVRRVVAPEEVARAQSLETLGERRQAREVREQLFVAALGAWLDCAGAVLVGDVVDGLALLLRVSPATTKRYLRAHASPFGEFVMDGDFVRVRR